MSTSETAQERMINPLKARLDAGKPAIGITISMPSVHVTQVLATCGFDWLFLDMEHGPIGIESVHAMITATNGTRAAPVVRVPWNVHWLAKPVLDAGAMGVIFPMIRSAADAEEAVRCGALSADRPARVRSLLRAAALRPDHADLCRSGR